MINRFFFLFSAVLLSWGINAGIASGSFPITHTQYTPELKPASFIDLDNSYQVASVCFLGSGTGCGDGGFNKGGDDYEVDTRQQCKNEGFVNSCSSGYCMDHSCPYNNTYGKCLKENCPANSSTTCTGAVDGKNACGVDCKKCCVTSCPSGYDYSESQLTGGNGNGWIKDGNDYCDHCTRGKLYKRKAATCSVSQTCSCGGSGQCKSGNNTYYASCNCCSNCNGSTSPSGMRYYNSCYNSCTGQTLYTERSCDNSCRGDVGGKCPNGYREWTSQDGCGNTCYNCSCDPAFCVSKCTPGKNSSGQPGVTLALKIKFCDESSFRDYENKWEFASSGGYCVNLDGGRHMYISTNWGMTYVTWCP